MSYFYIEGAGVVGLVCKAQIEIISVRLALQGKKVESVEYVEGERANWADVSRWQHSSADKLNAGVRPSDAAIATAKLYVYVVDSVGVDNGEVLDALSRDGTRVTAVAEKDPDSKRLERRVFKVVACPTL